MGSKSETSVGAEKRAGGVTLSPVEPPLATEMTLKLRDWPVGYALTNSRPAALTEESMTGIMQRLAARYADAVLIRLSVQISITHAVPITAPAEAKAVQP